VISQHPVNNHSRRICGIPYGVDLVETNSNGIVSLG
jgi:hypothetical protein